ncbi:hypothetical protein IWX91DRAFT_406975 [Phyllosticta citricarpa]
MSKLHYRPLLPNQDGPSKGPDGGNLGRGFYPRPRKSRQGTLVVAACGACRHRKSKCDGGRPQCQQCKSKDTECIYDTPPNETRTGALKARNEELQQEVASMKKVLDMLRSRPTMEAEDLLKRLRAGDNFQSLSGPAATEQSSGSVANHSADQVDTPGPMDLDHDFSPGGMDAELAGAEFTLATDDTKQLPTVRPIPPLHLPDAQECKRAVIAFFKYSGSLFHVFTLQQGIDDFNQVYGEGREPSRVALCELFSIAAIGSQHLAPNIESDTCDMFFNLARLYFEDIIYESPLNGMRVSALLGMWNIMSKDPVALNYVETGIRLAEKHYIAGEIRPIELDEASWMDYKRVFNTLLFLESWISTTMESLEQSRRSDVLFRQTNIARSGDQYQLVQTEIARCAILGAQVLRMLWSFRYNSFSVVESMIQDLERWYAGLPETIKLSSHNANHHHHHPANGLGMRIITSFLHLIYYGNIILCRRFLTHEPSAGSVHAEQFRELRSRYSKQAVSAALEASRIMRSFGEVLGTHDRCWLVISQAYSSCTVLLFAVAESLIQDQAANDYLDAAEVCFDILTRSAKGDQVARLLQARVAHLYDFWKNAVVGPGTATTARTSSSNRGTSSPRAMYSSRSSSSSSSETRVAADVDAPFAELVRLIQQPFVEGGEVAGFEAWGSGVATNVAPSWRLRQGTCQCSFEWKLAAVIPFNWVYDENALKS